MPSAAPAPRVEEIRPGRLVPRPEEADGESPFAVQDGRIPFIVRIAGLSASVLREFVSPRCIALAERIDGVLRCRQQLQQQATESLYSEVPELDGVIRREALRARRDLFNGRVVGASLSKLLPWVSPELRVLLESLLSIQGETAELEQDLEAAYVEDRERLRVSMLGACAEPGFERGLALASRSLPASLQRLRAVPFAAYGRKERRAERSLARYLTRSTCKLSPFSTLTKVGLGVAAPEHSDNLSLVDGPWTTSSLVRLKTYIPQQWTYLLGRIPSARAGFALRLNNTLEEMGENWFRVIRPTALAWDSQLGDLRLVGTSQVKVRLTGELVNAALRHLRHGTEQFKILAKILSRECDEREDTVVALLEKLVDLGVIEQMPPWPSYHPKPEKMILEYLRQTSETESEEWRRVRELLSALQEAQEKFVTSVHPEQVVTSIESLAAGVSEALKELLPAKSALRLEHGGQDLYEDVVVLGRPGESQEACEIVRIDRRKAEELLEAGSLLWKLRGLFDRRHECLHTLWTTSLGRWPGRRSIPLLEFFSEHRSVWQAYVKHLIEQGPLLFNPLGLTTVDSLANLRASTITAVAESLEREGGSCRLPASALVRVLEKVPQRYQSPVGACLHAQPAALAGEEWVAHRLYEGTGRLSSRFNVVLPQGVREKFTDHHQVRSAVQYEGESAELVDVLFSQFTTVNCHWPQTRLVLELAGERTHLAAERTLTPGDLVVEIGAEEGQVRLRSRRGERLVPCSLSALHSSWLPTFVKFVALFGVDTRGGFEVPLPIERVNGLRFSPRLVVGNLIVRRRTWTVQRCAFPVAEANEATAFRRLWCWRRAMGVPEQVYWLEKVPVRVPKIDYRKPQYVDFRSTALVAAFVDQLRGQDSNDPVILEEALPVPEEYPVDSEGRPWATEVSLEAVAFGEARSSC